MRKKISMMLMFLMCGIFLFGCGKEQASDKLKVSVTINPIAEVVSAIGKDKVEVNKMVPDGSEAHDFEPKPKDLEILNNSKIFIYNGLGMEHWVEQVEGSINSDVTVVDASNGVNIIKVSDKHEHEAGEHSHGKGIDPHEWLSLIEIKQVAKNVLDSLQSEDPENKEYYQGNYNEFIKNVDDLYKEYDAKFKEVKNRNFITGHSAFGYLCRDFNLSQQSISGIWGEGEVTPKKLEELSNFCKENNIKVIFSEANESAKESETLAKESGAEVKKIYSLENKEDNMDYLQGMRYNLETIYESLK